MYVPLFSKMPCINQYLINYVFYFLFINRFFSQHMNGILKISVIVTGISVIIEVYNIGNTLMFTEF